MIVEESSRLNRTVTEFLDFARPQNPEMRPLELEVILANNLHVLAPEAERLGVWIVRSYQNQPVKIVGDSDLLYRAFLNIFNNALQAMEEKGGGTLRVSTQTSRQGPRRWVVAAVEDTGPGFSPGVHGTFDGSFFHHQGKRHRPGAFHREQYHRQPARQDGTQKRERRRGQGRSVAAGRRHVTGKKRGANSGR